MGGGELLLEVRCEEIPARMLAPGLKELGTRIFEELVALQLPPSVVETTFTPRRLVVTLQGLAARQSDRREEVMGPPVRAAFDAEGRPTEAARGFARRCGVETGQLTRVQTDKGEYVAAARTVEGRATRDILSELLPRLLTELSWPRTMRWGAGIGPWVRPVHGIVALFDGEIVPFGLFGVDAGRSTIGHPVLSPKPFEVKSAADYRRKLGRRGVQVRFELRAKRLLREMRERATGLGGSLVEDPELLDKLASICEIPGIVEGGFSRRYLELPREVLIATLRDHQSAFTVEGEEGLLPYFFTVMDRPDDPEGRVRAGNEWVVEARLSDARFFYVEDRKLPLRERRERLEHLTFHLRLGSYAEKTERIIRLSEVLCDELGWEGEKEAAREAAALLKTDLTTEMVKEFTSLQGIMGGVYAREEDAPEAIWQAIYDQYLPASTDDPIPRGRVGQVTTLADRIDTLVGIFGLGLVPTGSKDPLGLRRAAQGVVRIGLEGGLPLDLDLVAARAVLLYGDQLDLGGDEILAALRPFLYDRVRHLLALEGFAYDEIEASLAVGGSNLPDLRARVEALHRMRGEPGFLSVVLSAKRIANILKDAPEVRLDPALLREPAERALHEAALELRREVEAASAAGEYDRGLRGIAGFADLLERFFVEVLVMDPNQDLRRNRIALLQSIQRTLFKTARLSEIVVDKAEHRKRARDEENDTA